MARALTRLVIGLSGTIAGGFLLRGISIIILGRSNRKRPATSRLLRSCRLVSELKSLPSTSSFLPELVTISFTMAVGTTLVDRSDIESTVARVGSFISDSNADLVLFQEVDCGARRTAFVDEVTLLLNALPAEIRNHVSTYYWKSKFVPHPKILGAAGTKLVIFSRYRLGKARRYQLPCTP